MVSKEKKLSLAVELETSWSALQGDSDGGEQHRTWVREGDWLGETIQERLMASDSLAQHVAMILIPSPIGG